MDNAEHMPLPVSRLVMMDPGYLCLPASPARLCTQVASGVVVTMFDRQRSLGGMGHYLHPRRMGSESTSIFAAPALVELLNMFIQAGSRLDRLETFVYGGSDNPEVASNEFGRGGLNLRAGLEILTKLGVRVAGTDIGGRYARRLVFYTATGESVVAKVTDVLSADAWYPRLGGGSTLGRQS